MTLDSPKGGSSVTPFPRSLSTMAVSVGGLALFLVLASLLLVSYPIGSSVHGYFYGIDSSKKVIVTVIENNASAIGRPGENVDDIVADESGNVFDKNSFENVEVPSSDIKKQSPDENVDDIVADKSGNVFDKNSFENVEVPSSDIKKQSGSPAGFEFDKEIVSELRAEQNFSDVGSNDTESGKVDSDCDLYHGSWFYDPLGPSYTNNTCPVLTQMQNCQGNGRPDKEYENWRWKPYQCELPRFDAKKFLELMRGKTLAFIGDSVARNQMESMLCLLWQVETPKNRGNKRMQRYFFRSTSTMIVRIWSSWLVHQTSAPIDYAPDGVTKLHLDVPDETFMGYITNFDVMVLSSGHWFAKQSVYVLNNEIVGGQLWWPDKARPRKVNNIEAFGISVETILSSIVTHPNYTGLTIVRSYSPDHYDGGAWNTGGSCTGKEKPLDPGKLVENKFTGIMHQKQVTGFERAVKKTTNKSKLRLMDITEAYSYRHDGHPGPYRSPDPNKITKPGPDGRPPPQDCLHWCMPGPVDTWNELVLELIRREFENNQNSSS